MPTGPAPVAAPALAPNIAAPMVGVLWVTP
jgi:hypothetical protein